MTFNLFKPVKNLPIFKFINIKSFIYGKLQLKKFFFNDLKVEIIHLEEAVVTITVVAVRHQVQDDEARRHIVTVITIAAGVVVKVDETEEIDHEIGRGIDLVISLEIDQEIVLGPEIGLDRGLETRSIDEGSLNFN